MKRLEVCPFRIHRERKSSITRKGDYTEDETFMECLKEKCPAYYIGFIKVEGAINKYPAECCRRLEK